MDDEEPTLRNMAREFATPGYRDRARKRKAASKTGWDLIFLPIGFAAIGGYWYGFTRLFLWLHFLVFPADLQHSDAVLGGSLTLPQALMFLVPMFSAVPLGLMTSNVLMWLVPPARRASEKKAEGVKWASFRQAQLVLFKMALVLVPIGLIAGVAGALIVVR